MCRVAGVNAEYRTEEEKGELFLSLGKMTERERRDCDVILETMLLGIEDLYEGFSAFIKLEVKDDVY